MPEKRCRTALVILAGLALAGSGCLGRSAVPGPWRVLEPGLEISHFDSRTGAPVATGDFTVLRVDPRHWTLKVITTQIAGDDRPRTLSGWCEDFHLIAAINAGMYQQDGRTHVGYCQVDGKVINPVVNKYKSAAAMDPVEPGEPPFRIFDLDETDLAQVKAAYRTVVQNLRLIKRPGEPRWPRTQSSWSEAALGEDKEGRALLMHCTRPLSMHDFNEIVLSLPLDLVCAQHLEGNFPAQLWVQHPGLAGDSRNQVLPGQALPLILGVAARTP